MAALVTDKKVYSVYNNQMSIEDFIASETTRLIEFAAAYRNCRKDKPEQFPETMPELSFFRHYMAYAAKQHEKKLAA